MMPELPELWDSLLERRYALVCPLHAERQRSVFREFDRIGLSGVVPFWNPRTKYEDRLRDGIGSLSRYLRSPAVFSCNMGHIRILETAKQLGGSTLVMEDDIRFQRDPADVADALSCVPGDWDVLMLDWFPKATDVSRRAWKWEHGRNQATRRWHRIKSELRSFGCIAFRNARVVEHFVWHLSSWLDNPKWAMRHVDTMCCPKWLHPFNGYYAWPPVAIQREAGDGMSSSQAATRKSYNVNIHDYTETMGLDLSAYGEPSTPVS